MRSLKRYTFLFINGKRLLIVSLIVMNAVSLAYADQYRSKELSAPQSTSKENEKSIADLEQELSGIKDAYSRASTARFLARFYLQAANEHLKEKSVTNEFNKAIEYYRASLDGDGLSDIAKQQTVLELADIYFYQKKYADFIQTLNLFEKYGGDVEKQGVELRLKQAIAFYHQGENKQAVQVADDIYGTQMGRSLNADSKSVLEQLLYIYFNAGHYSRSAKIQKIIISLEQNNAQHWLRLVNIYLKANEKQKAAEALLLMKQKKLTLSSQQLLLMCDLLASTGNPYMAARQLQSLLDDKTLPASVMLYNKIFNYWYQAQEVDKAISALVSSARISPDVEMFLMLAELYMQQQQWPEMQANVLKACEKNIADEFVSRANLLLGVSELKQGNTASARQAFINATLVGGRGDAANGYLTFMQAPPATDSELSQFYGPCKPVWASGGSRQLSLAGVSGFAVQGGSDSESKKEMVQEATIDFQVKTVHDQRLIVGDYTLKVSEFEEKLLPLAMKLGMGIMKEGGKISGPMHFLFPEPVPEGADKISFQMAFPVSKVPRNKGRYHLLEDSGFYCASYLYEGSPEGLAGAWKAFYLSVTSAHHHVTGVGRQLVINPKKARRDFIQMELQMELASDEPKHNDS